MGRKRGLVEGRGYHTDFSIPTMDGEGRRVFEYTTWANMLKRCYNPKSLKNSPSYQGKEVAKEWWDYGVFYKWCKSYDFKQQGWQLDKDLLFKGNTIYSEEACVFLPPALNSIMLSCKTSRGDLPVGVHFDKSRGRYKATCCSEFGKQWQKRFDTIEEAFSSYKLEKERVIKVVALQYKDTLDPRAYEALINYQVEITD